MKCLVVAIVGFALSFFGGAASAQTQYDLNVQARANFEKADAKLNVMYNSLKGKLDDDGKQKLREAEKAWIKFRDAEAESQADAYRGGSIQPMIYNDCLTALTEKRTTELEARIKDLDSH